MTPLPGVFPLALTLQKKLFSNSNLLVIDSSPYFQQCNSLQGHKLLLSWWEEKNGMFRLYMHAWMFHSLFTLYLLPCLCFPFSLFIPSLLELQPKAVSHNLFRPVCICVWFCTEVLKKRQIESHVSSVHTPTCMSAHKHMHKHEPRGFILKLFPVWGEGSEGK